MNFSTSGAGIRTPSVKSILQESRTVPGGSAYDTPPASGTMSHSIETPEASAAFPIPAMTSWVIETRCRSRHAHVMLNLLLATLLLPLAVGAAWHGARLLAKGIREADDPSGPVFVVRGIRAVAVAAGVAALGGGVLFAHTGLLAFGAIFLGEELYETGVVLLTLRAGLRAGAS